MILSCPAFHPFDVEERPFNRKSSNVNLKWENVKLFVSLCELCYNPHLVAHGGNMAIHKTTGVQPPMQEKTEPLARNHTFNRGSI